MCTIQAETQAPNTDRRIDIAQIWRTYSHTLSCIRLHARLVADGKRLGAEEMLAQYELASKAELTVGRLGDAVCTWYLLGDEKTDARIEGNVRTLLAPQRAAAA